MLVEELGDEAVVYDLDSHMVHHLDRRAFRVWRSCDGHRTTAMIVHTIAEDEGQRPDQEAIVEVALHQLQKAGLLLPDEDEAAGSARRLPTRRQLLTGGAAAGVAGLLLVHSIAAPTAAQAASPPPPPGPSDAPDCSWVFDGTAWSCQNGARCGENGGNLPPCRCGEEDLGDGRTGCFEH
jgi:hypothetical protein